MACNRSLLWIGILCVIHGMCVLRAHAEAPMGNGELATVFGHVIRYADIEADRSSVDAQFLDRYNRTPQGGVDDTLWSTLRHEIEMRRLAIRIRRFVRANEIATRKIVISTEAIEIEWQKTLDSGLRAAIREDRPRLSRILAALAKVYDEKQDAATVYQDALVDVLSKDEWNTWVTSNRDPAERRALGELYLAEKPMMTPSLRGGIRESLQNRELDQSIDDELKRGDPSFADARRILDGPAGADLRSEKVSAAYQYIRARREEWWIDRCRRADVRVTSPDFEKWLDVFRGANSAATRPN